MDTHSWLFCPEKTIMFCLCCCHLCPYVCMYVEGVDMNGWRNLHLQPFLKHDAEWDAECSSNLYFSNVSRMQLFPQNGSDSNAQPPFIWYKKGVCSHVQPSWWKWNDCIGPVISCPYALNNSTFPSIQRLVDNICSRYGLLTVFTKHYPPSDVVI